MIVFCGKGGTGKTSLAIAAGLRSAQRGRSTLVVTTHPLKELAASVSLAGLKETSPEAAEKLFIVHLDPVQAVDAVVERSLPAGALRNALLGSSIYKTLVEVAPGLKEIATLNRLRHLSEEKYEHLIWDAPATGHFLDMLRVARNFETWLSGPFALLGAQVAEFTADAHRFSIVPVCTLEEMAVRETIEMCATLTADLNASPAHIICNQTSPLAGFAVEPEHVIAQLHASDEAKAFLRARSGVERALYAELAQGVQAQLHPVRSVYGWSTSLDLLGGIAAQLGAIS